MNTVAKTQSAAVRERLNHPVIDGDGHFVALVDVLADYVREIGGPKALEKWRATLGASTWYELTPQERRDRTSWRPGFWTTPKANALDAATVSLPDLFRARLDDLGIDFAILYPTGMTGLRSFAHEPDEDQRRILCRAFNTMTADLYGPHADRMTPAALIPTTTPAEAVDEIEFVVKNLGIKVISLASRVQRPIAEVERTAPAAARYATWIDTLAQASQYDYDPLWAKCVELKLAVTSHSGSVGIGFRTSTESFIYNQIGHFAAAGDAFCKALIFGGVVRRFPTLHFAFLEGGVGWASILYNELIDKWRKRNIKALRENLDPAKLDRAELANLFERYGGKLAKAGFNPFGEIPTPPNCDLDEWSALDIDSAEAFPRFFSRFFFGCEADDRMTSLAFNPSLHHYEARLQAFFSSDIGHWDVPDLSVVLAEAYELLEDGFLSEDDFRDFTFKNVTKLHGGMNPDFFKGTVVEQATAAVLLEVNDLVIRDVEIVDGSGRPRYAGDIAVTGDVLTQVGGVAGAGKREIDGSGCIATPGFVDIHTHYDAQVHWDPWLTSSSWNGVTTVVMGNCGVGFAPARPSNRESLMELMSVIEEIPTESLRAGLKWDWETFPEFLDALERRPLGIDVGVQVPHAAVRGYVMGERGMNNEPATPDEQKAMENLVREAMAAGALGLTGTRSVSHRSPAGKDPTGFGLPIDEMVGLARAAGEAKTNGAVGLNLGEMEDLEGEVGWLRRINEVSGLRTWALLNQTHYAPERFPRFLDQLTAASKDGVGVIGQFPGRPISYLMGLLSSRNPFSERPVYKEIAGLPLAERVALLKDPAFRQRLMNSEAVYARAASKIHAEAFHRMFRLGDPPDYEPPPETSIAAIAAAAGRPPQDVALDIMLERDGHELILVLTANYLDGDLSAIWRMFHHPNTVLGLGDAGAHVTRMSDASTPTYMLTHWARDRSRGPKLTLEDAVKKQTSATSDFFGLKDRGLLVPGRKADINVIDFAGLTLHAPEMIVDQPAGKPRLIQKADGYLATIVNGTPIMEKGEPTGATPGKLIRAVRGAR